MSNDVHKFHETTSVHRDGDGEVREQPSLKELPDSPLSEGTSLIVTDSEGKSVAIDHELKISSKMEMKINGGQPAEPGAYPYQVSIQVLDLFGNRHICGGAIISEIHVLTVAQCVSSQSISNLQVVAGDYSLSDTSGYEQVRSVEAITVHPNFAVGEPQKNDIAIIKVPEPFVYGSMVVNIYLSPQDVTVGQLCVTTGWGSTSESGDYSDTLMEVAVLVLEEDQCQSVYGEEYDSGSMVCAGDATDIKDFCQGDEGGPLNCGGFLQGLASWGVAVLVLEEDQCQSVYGEEYDSESMVCAGDATDIKDFCQGDEGGPLNCGGFLQGLASWGVGCGRGNPGVYTRVYNYTKWIEEVVLTDLGTANFTAQSIMHATNP
ncbi:Serine proteases trypsin domain [Trinorchestia longiramus]|nr:Serine proteases trypsin domain [Trinorchestia longiramus]